MATQTRMNPVYFGNTDCAEPLLHGGAEETYFKETASQAWKKGDLIYLDSNGTLAICTRTSTKLNSAIAGQALANATGTTGTAVNFRVIRPNDLYWMNVYHSSAGSAITAQTQLGVNYGIIYQNDANSVNRFFVDIENTTIEDGTTALGKVSVVGFPSLSPDGATNAIGDTYGFVLVKFIPFTIETDGGNIVRNLQLGG